MANMDYLGRIQAPGLSLEGMSTPVVYDKISLTIDGGGNVIPTGFAGMIEVPFDCELQRVTGMADQSGDCEVDIWLCDFASTPPTVNDSITSVTPFTISSAVRGRDSTLTGWTRNFSSGQVLGFNVNSVANITRLNMTLVVKRS